MKSLYEEKVRCMATAAMAASTPAQRTEFLFEQMINNQNETLKYLQNLGDQLSTGLKDAGLFRTGPDSSPCPSSLPDWYLDNHFGFDYDE